MKTAKKTAKAVTSEVENVSITAPKMHVAEFNIIGTAPFVQLRFSKKGELMDKMALGSQAKNKKDRKARDYEAEFKAAQHVSDEGWNGIPAGSFRNAMISACRLVNFKMTLAKLSISVIADGFDADEGVPLVKIQGKPELCTHHTRNATGVCDVRTRAKYWPWAAKVRVQYDADQFSSTDVANLMARVGAQVGIGEGRPDSKSSAGMGWGTFRLG